MLGMRNGSQSRQKEITEIEEEDSFHRVFSKIFLFVYSDQGPMLEVKLHAAQHCGLYASKKVAADAVSLDLR